MKDVNIIIVNLRNGYRNVSTNEIKIADRNTHKHRGQNESSGNKQDDLYRTKSTKIKNMNSNECNKEICTCTSNEKGLIKNNYASSSENLVITPKASSSFLSSHNRNLNSIVRKSASKSMTKRTKVFHTRMTKPISLTNKVIAKKDNIYDNKAMISNATIYSKKIY